MYSGTEIEFKRYENKSVKRTRCEVDLQRCHQASGCISAGALYIVSLAIFCSGIKFIKCMFP